MRRGLVVLVIVGSALGFARPAVASVDECSATAAAFQSEHARIHRQAGAPSYLCVPNNGDGQQGRYDKAANTIAIEAQPSAANYPPLIAHETGHAWAETRHVTYSTYGEVRGFVRPSISEVPAWTQTVFEDYAETFAWSLGAWHELDGLNVPSPYAFQNDGGVPTPDEVALLRAARLLPGCVNDWMPTVC